MIGAYESRVVERVVTNSSDKLCGKYRKSNEFFFLNSRIFLERAEIVPRFSFGINMTTLCYLLCL